MVAGAGEEPPPQAVSATPRSVASTLAPRHRQRCMTRVGGRHHAPEGTGIVPSSEVVLEVKQEGLRRWPSPTPLPFTRHRHRPTPVG